MLWFIHFSLEFACLLCPCYSSSAFHPLATPCRFQDWRCDELRKIDFLFEKFAERVDYVTLVETYYSKSWLNFFLWAFHTRGEGNFIFGFRQKLKRAVLLHLWCFSNLVSVIKTSLSICTIWAAAASPLLVGLCCQVITTWLADRKKQTGNSHINSQLNVFNLRVVSGTRLVDLVNPLDSCLYWHSQMVSTDAYTRCVKAIS